MKSPQQSGSKFETKVKNSIRSGGLWFSPLDLSTDTHLVECKYTDQKGYRITKDLVAKIWKQALSIQKEPILVIGIKRDEDTMFTLNCQIQVTKGM